MENNISVDDLAVFLAVLREGGFRAAAERLCIAPSKVSTTVTRIESQLGVPLLRRTTRSLHVTEAGGMLAERVGPLLAAFRAACVEVATRGGEVRGKLKLNVPGAVMPELLPPLLARYQELYPAVEVEIVVESGLVDIVASGCDAGIRYASVLEQDMITVPIGPRRQRLALGAAPSYLQSRKMPEAPDDLTCHNAIRYRLDRGPLLPWTFKRGEQDFSVEPINSLVLSVAALDTGVAFAREGMGIIQTFRAWLEGDFSAGTLVEVLPGWSADLEGPYLYYPNRTAPPPLRAFIDICRTVI